MAHIQHDYIVSLFNGLNEEYDRVRPNINTVTTRRIGLSKEEAICHTTVLQKWGIFFALALVFHWSI